MLKLFHSFITYQLNANQSVFCVKPGFVLFSVNVVVVVVIFCDKSLESIYGMELVMTRYNFRHFE